MSEIEIAHNSRISPFSELTISCIVHISPEFIHDIEKGVRDALDKRVMKYIADATTLLSYSNLQLPERAYMFDANNLLHIKISFDAVVFSLKIGDVIEATVNYVAKAYTAFTIYGFFKATSDITDDWELDETDETQRKWINEYGSLEANDSVTFKVTQIIGKRIIGTFDNVKKHQPQTEHDDYESERSADEEDASNDQKSAESRKSEEDYENDE